MPAIWNEQLASIFWSKRAWHVITRNDQLQIRQEAREAQIERNCKRENDEKQKFLEKNSHLLHHASASTNANMKIISDLSFWMQYCSWTSWFKMPLDC